MKNISKKKLIDATGWTFRRIILICIIICFILGFYLIIIGNNFWIVLHLTGFFGLIWTSFMRKIYEDKDKKKENKK